MKNTHTLKMRKILLGLTFLLFNVIQAQVFHNNFSSYEVNSITGNATWTENTTNNEFTYNNNGEGFKQRAILYSTETYQSNEGFQGADTFRFRC